MKFFQKTLAFVVIISILSSCASIVSKSRWPLSINSTPSKAKVEIRDKHGVTIYSGQTPTVVSLKSGAGFFTKQSYVITFKLDGYDDRTIPVDCTINGWYFGNLIFGGLIGLLIVDPATGAMYRLEQEYIH